MKTEHSSEPMLAHSLSINIDHMSDAEVDSLPIGAIKVTTDGTIIFYNETESKLSGRKAKRVIGKNFFRDVAPCTNMPGFFGRF